MRYNKSSILELEIAHSLLIEILKEFNIPDPEELLDKVRALSEGSNTAIESRIFIDSIITLAEKNIPPDKFDDLLLKMSRFFLDKGELDISSELIHNLISKTNNGDVLAESHLLLADVGIRRTDWKNAIQNIDAAKKHFDTLKNSDGLARCFNLLGILHGEKGEINNAIKFFAESLELLKSSADDKLHAEVETNIAITKNIQGNCAEAQNHFVKALRYFENLGNTKKTSELHHNIGMMLMEQSDYDAALKEFDKAIGLAVKGKHLTTLVIAYLGKSEALLNLNNIEGALEFAHKAMDLAIVIQDKLTTAEVYRLIGSLERKLNHYETARMYLDISFRLNTNLENKLNIAETALELARLAEDTNNSEECINWYKRALEYYSEINAVNKIKKIEEKLRLSVN